MFSVKLLKRYYSIYFSRMNYLKKAFDYNSLAGASDSATVDKQKLLAERKACIGSKCQVFYDNNPIIVERAFMQYVYDSDGHRLLDCISNVQHVGHCHPQVVSAISDQLAKSTCNARFISSKMTECAQEILSTLPGLDVIIFCNSGSEANDLALRLARDFTGHHDVIVLEHAYHGHVTTTMEMSPYKFDHGATVTKPDWVHVTPVPDVYRGRIRLHDSELHDEAATQRAGEAYADALAEVLNAAIAKGRQFSAFIGEALQSCGGQIITPRGYLPRVAELMRKHGALTIIDEVQTGFGRVGTFWAHRFHENDGFVADIVTMGKPMGNGFPVSAVATRKEIADVLGGGVGYFNTYGGNPVACAAALAVMRVLRDEHLVEHAQQIGTLFAERLGQLQKRHECIGDVRGLGMFWGVDLVVSRKTREPATRLALNVIARLRETYAVLLSADGPRSNVLKFKPPLCFSAADVEESIRALDDALTACAAAAISNNSYENNKPGEGNRQS